MDRFEVEDRVYCKSPFVEGYGIISYINHQGYFNHSLSPIQVLMENEGDHGHKVYRFSVHELEYEGDRT